MGESERAQVGQALDLLRDALGPYVDSAMVQALGPNWPNVVAEENAKRRRDGRTFPVSKRDLIVLLQAIMHRRIEPWGGLHDYPRVRSYAGELLSLRHLHHHGDDCVGEYARFTDTASRFLSVLGLPVPNDLIHHPESAAKLPPEVHGAVPERREAPASLSDVELANLGELGQRLGEILAKAAQLTVELGRESRQLLGELDPSDPDFETFTRDLMQLYRAKGPEALALFTETESVQVDQAGSDIYLLAALRFWALCELASDPLGQAVKAFAVQAQIDHEHAITKALQHHRKRRRTWRKEGRQGAFPEFEFPTEDARIAEAQRLSDFRQGQPLYWRQLIQLADLVGPGSTVASSAAVRADLQTAQAIRSSEDVDDGEALPFVRDAIARTRFNAGMEPGSSFETLLVFALRLEGEICNDLGQPEDAIKAFARADEIVDRYPAAEPALVQQDPP